MSKAGQEGIGSSSASTAASGAAEKAKVPRPVPAFLQPLRYMGVPQSVLAWKPRLPSRNWSIFYGVALTLTSLYVYDRRECKRIKEEYFAQLQHLSKEPLAPYEYPRKLHVYTAKSPGDDDPEKSLLFFKLYVKPFLVAAGIDWTNTNGMRHGGLARELRERHYSRRRQLLGLEPWGTPPSTSMSKQIDPWMAGAVPFALTPQQQLEHELDGGIVLVGRPAYKEWAWALREGWTTRLPPRRQDLEEEFAETLLNDSAFDEEEDEVKGLSSDSSEFVGEELDGAGAPLPSRIGSGPTGFNPAFQMVNARGSSGSSALQARKEKDGNIDVHEPLLEPPSEIPAQPPITFVDYTNLTGFRYVPRKIVGFFRHRDRFELGAQAAMNIALGRKSEAREFDVVCNEAGDVARQEPPQSGDLDWGLASETFYPKRFKKTLVEIEEERTKYYKDLKQRLKDSRSYYRGERELAAMEKNDPPKAEGDLREERYRRERDWSLLTMAYNILRTDAGVSWHPSFAGRLRVFAQQEKRPIIQGTDEEEQEKRQS